MSNDSRIIEGELVPSPSRELDRPQHHGGSLDIVGGPPAPAAQVFDVRRLVLQSLRGRYILSLVLGLIVGGAFGAVAWKMGRPVYVSEGIVRIAYTMPTVLQETDASRPLANFEQFMYSQRMVITSRRVIELAAQHPVWQQNGAGSPTGLAEYYADNLKVDTRPRSEYIAISVTDTDPAMAGAAVVALVNAYAEYYNQNDKDQERQLLGVLEDRQTALQASISDIQKQIENASQDYGSAQLDPFYTAAAGHLTRLDTALAEVRLAIASTPPESDTPAPAPQQPVGQDAPVAQDATTTPATQPVVAVAPPPIPELTAEEIAINDVGMRTYLDERDRCLNEIRRLGLLRLGEAHRDVIIARQSLAEAESRITKYVERYRRFQAMTAAVAAPQAPTSPNVLPGTTQPANGASAQSPLAGRTLASLRSTEASILKLQGEYKQELVALGNRKAELEKLGLELTRAQSDLITLTRKVDALRAEGRLGGRLSIVSSGDVPVSPIRDTRMRNAAAGAMAGVFVPASLFILLGFVRQRYRYSEDTEADLAAHIPLLGILPEHSMKDPAQNPAAAHSVHQIRVSLASNMTRNRSSVYLVTSATAGEGKTTVAVSLALSFAAAKVRTLLIDCDLVGRHLTASLEGREIEGMREALKSGTLLKSVRKTYSGLYVLTAGKAAAPDAVSVPAESVRVLFAEARKYFQVIIVDSGPILGSLEAAVLAQEADGVIFAITRGQHRELVQRALRRLNGLGAQICGFIFNRAKPQDFHRTAYASSTPAAMDPDGQVEPADMWQGESLKRFSPLVQAVASGIRMSDN